MKSITTVFSIFLTAFFFLEACDSKANFHGAPDQTSQSNTDKSGMHEFTMASCRFKIKNLFGGWFDVQNTQDGVGSYRIPGRGNIINWSFMLNCNNPKDQDSIDAVIDAKKVGDKWIWVDSGKPFNKTQNFKMFDLKGANWTGTGVTFDQITGEETQRQRQFSFCLFRSSQALCGSTFVSSTNHPMDSTADKIKAILQTIEFVDPP